MSLGTTEEQCGYRICGVIGTRRGSGLNVVEVMSTGGAGRFELERRRAGDSTERLFRRVFFKRSPLDASGQGVDSPTNQQLDCRRTECLRKPDTLDWGV